MSSIAFFKIAVLSMKHFAKKKHFSINVIDLTIDFMYENLSQLVFFVETQTKGMEMPMLLMSFRSLSSMAGSETKQSASLQGFVFVCFSAGDR